MEVTGVVSITVAFIILYCGDILFFPPGYLDIASAGRAGALTLCALLKEI